VGNSHTSCNSSIPYHFQFCAQRNANVWYPLVLRNSSGNNFILPHTHANSKKGKGIAEPCVRMFNNSMEEEDTSELHLFLLLKSTHSPTPYSVDVDDTGQFNLNSNYAQQSLSEAKK
jgi:hypothetical protein